MLRRISHLGWYRGVLGGSRGWAALWLGVAVARQVRKAAARDVQVLSLERLTPGQAVLVTSLGPPPTRRQRRRAARTQAG